MALTSTGWEAQSLRRHLGYGNIGLGAHPHTPDGFLQLFEQVILPNLETAAETTGSTAITAGATNTVTVASITGIVAQSRLVVDVGDDAEVVTVKSVSGSTFTAAFAKAHPASGYPVVIESGTSILRMLLHSADKAYAALQSSDITGSAGLKSVGRSAIEWHPGGVVLMDIQRHYRSIVAQIGSLVRVPPLVAEQSSCRLEGY